MTEYEAVELGQIYFANFISTNVLFISLITGYLVIAYVVGSTLKLSQVSIINGIFLVVVAWSTWAGFAYVMGGAYYAAVGGSMNPERVIYAGPMIGYVTVAVYVFVTLACLKFMWDVRHPKTE